jgi:hypothetical protein
MSEPTWRFCLGAPPRPTRGRIGFGPFLFAHSPSRTAGRFQVDT